MKDNEYKNIWDYLKEKGIDPLNTLPDAMIKRIEAIGTAKEKLLQILDHNIWIDLSKHNPYWESQHEVESEKLHDLRMILSLFHDKLWDVWGTLHHDEEQ